MTRCFVIQPFDEGEYDRRYKEVISPAIKAAGLEPYRVDQDPSVTGIMESIEEGIEDSAVCLADISINNPNVWYELGYARASKRQVVLLCESDKRDAFPFDVKNLPIIKYETSAPSDFESASLEITQRLKAILGKIDSEKVELFLSAFPGKVSVEKIVESPDSVTSDSHVDGLEPYEIAGLVAVAEADDPMHGINLDDVRKHMGKAGFSPVVPALAMEALVSKGMLERYTRRPEGRWPWSMYRITSEGWDWMSSNSERLSLRGSSENTQDDIEITDDDIPF